MIKHKIHEARAGERKIELFDSDRLEHAVHIDGVHGFSFDEDGNLRMDLFTLGPDSTPGHQQRDLACRVVMPPAQFMHFARSVHHQARQLVAAAKARDALAQDSMAQDSMAQEAKIGEAATSGTP